MIINVNCIFFIFTGSVLVVNTLKFNKKAKIVTPQDSGQPASSNTPNYYPWPVPFFADNDFGYISTIFPVNPPPPPPPPVPQPTSTPAAQLPPATTGSTAPATTPSTTTVVNNRISQEKCLEYRLAGRRYTRKSQVQVFIIGGQNSKQNEFPHMAALGYGPKTENHNNWLCGGSLISDLYVVTAAHCLSEHSLGYVSYVRLGTTTLQTETLDSEDYNIVRRIAHPNYVEGKQYDDIALLQLDRPVTFSEHISPICLFTSSSLEGRSLVAVGWGKTSDTGSIAKELQKVDLDYVSSNVCQQAYSVVPKEDLPRGIVDPTQVCAGVPDGTRDTCQGDSGGPLQLQQDGGAYLVGITSFGIGCGTPGIPGVYTRISYYVPWIENVVWGR